MREEGRRERRGVGEGGRERGREGGVYLLHSKHIMNCRRKREMQKGRKREQGGNGATMD